MGAYLASYVLLPFWYLEPPPSKTSDVLNALESNASDIISGIPDFYRYDYGYDPNSLRDGGNGLFTSYGMEVR